MSERLRLRSGELSWREIDGEVVAIDVQTSTYFSANSSGAILWQMLSEGATHDELVERLTARFEIDRERAETDVAAFVGALHARGLLES
jgi:hypothetical protein